MEQFYEVLNIMKQLSVSSILFHWTQQQAREHIQLTSQKKGLCIVNFLYFARAMKFDVYKDEVKSEYKDALFHSDILCIDWIAMQVFDRCGQLFFWWKRKWTENLNWTDFLPYILNQTRNKKIWIIMSTVYDPKINKWTEWMEKWLKKLKELYPHIDVIFKYQTIFQKRGEDFPIEDCINVIKKEKNNYDHIFFLNWIGWPKQEIWTEKHKHHFENTGVIIMNNWATLDYYSGFETRAPQRVVKIRIGETFRRVITQPEKNLKKFTAMFKIFWYRWYLLKKYVKKVVK